MRTLALRPHPWDGDLSCHARVWPTDPPCPNAATWHIAWLLAPRGHFSLVCDSHLTALRGTYDYVDQHPAQATCAMPGTGWETGPVPSRCVLVTTDQIKETGQP